ncbi:hypothetical protein SEVIR_1G166500v4 [Setaria viridis]|uniref:Demeter RRM-fold domain-containing protein n=2 Tax=Setaria viridis TaxID=4556 RepID=A0A4U6WLI3_SETVI|nr:transcriptional activator DEMETER-like [Setaria viridis]TKW39247.1 hypothetical protein SEVIR_1G166500v2 [Setaria viridis]
MAAVAEAEADLGPQLGRSPATPDIVCKPAQASWTSGADGSCCTALFTSAATALAAGPGKAESDGFTSVPSPVQEQSQSVPKDLGEVDCAQVSTQESSTLPPLVGKFSDKIAQQEQQQQQEEGVASGSDAGGAAPVPTPEKVEPTPRRRWKKSTKGVLRFKVVKDKVVKPKVTPKTATPRKVKKDKKQQMPEDGSHSAGAASSNSARRKLDLDSSQSKTCFSRAELMNNLKCLAKSHALNAEPTRRKRSKRGRKRKQMILAQQGTLTGASSSALVPLWGSAQLDIACYGNHGKRLWNKVLGLTEETLRVCDVLAKWDGSDSESFEGFDIGSGPEWDQTRHVFERLVDIFIAAMLDLLGPRKFSPWGGSLIDSVVGTFLTQNVADNLSSHAFMNLAAKFPPRKRCHKAEDCSNTAPLVDGVDENLNPNEAYDTFDSVDSDFDEYIDSEEEDGHDTEAKGHYGEEYNRLIENFIDNLKENGISTWDSDLMNLVKDKSGNPICTERTLRKFVASLRPVPSSIWKELREEAYRKGYSDTSRTSDAVDWESVLHAPIAEVAKCIELRGQHYILALRIQVFLMNVKKAQDGSFDLDWLRYISREKAKNFLLSIHGIGVKSADCIRLLSLRHKAFPVDVNVARIVTRLGWVKLQPINGAEFHLINSYPIMRDVQRYLWPRLCTIDKEKLYELHCLMITFGKVMCTKINPNCSACPFSAQCKYSNSSLARKSLPPPEKHEHEHGEQQSSMVASGRFLLSNDSCMPSAQHMYQHQIEISRTAETPPIHNCEPIVEMPQSPEYEYEAPNEQEDFYEDHICDLEDIVPGVQYDGEIDLCSSKHVLNSRSWTPKCGKDLVVMNPKSSFSPNKKLKNVGRLRTEHNAYVLPDDHVILEEFEERVPEDLCPYLLVIISCPNDYTVEGTVLIPCRTANRGKFPLNGTYFQANEVFADHSSSRHPITIPRECIGMLDRSIVYFGSSIHSITRGQTRHDIEECFKKGYVCVRGFHRRTRTPMRLCSTLHANTIKKEAIKKEAMKKEGGETPTKRARTSPEGKSKEKKASSANQVPMAT